MNSLRQGMPSVKVIRVREDFRAHGPEDTVRYMSKGCLFCKPKISARCGDKSPITHLITCTRVPDHDGRHAACTVQKHPYEVW